MHWDWFIQFECCWKDFGFGCSCFCFHFVELPIHRTKTEFYVNYVMSRDWRVKSQRKTFVSFEVLDLACYTFVIYGEHTHATFFLPTIAYNSTPQQILPHKIAYSNSANLQNKTNEYMPFLIRICRRCCCNVKN